jgi:PKHD-type hydroxylase
MTPYRRHAFEIHIMIIVIPDILPRPLVDQIVKDLGQLPWHAGDTTDSDYAAAVKQNQELKEQDHPLVKRYAQAILEAVLTNEQLRTTVFPSMGKVPQFNKYEGGGAYHRHSDSAFIGRPEIRTDLSVTVFLSDPDEYEGGELTLEYPSGEVRRVKEKKAPWSVTPRACCTTSRR